jgi:hypothetical protein
MNIQTLAFIVGIILGTGALISVFYVWIKKQVFGSGGTVLSLIGVTLVGLSVWSSVRISVTGSGITTEFERLQQQVQKLSKANSELTSSLNDVASIVEQVRVQNLEVVDQLHQKNVIDAATAKSLRTPLTDEQLNLPQFRKRLDAMQQLNQNFQNGQTDTQP